MEKYLRIFFTIFKKIVLKNWICREKKRHKDLASAGLLPKWPQWSRKKWGARTSFAGALCVADAPIIELLPAASKDLLAGGWSERLKESCLPSSCLTCCTITNCTRAMTHPSQNTSYNEANPLNSYLQVYIVLMCMEGGEGKSLRLWNCTTNILNNKELFLNNSKPVSMCVYVIYICKYT